MRDLDAIADRVEIEALRGEFTDAVMMRDYDRLASLFTEDGVVRMPRVNAEATSREQNRAGVARMQGLWRLFVQNAHPGTIELEGDTARGRAYGAHARARRVASQLRRLPRPLRAHPWRMEVRRARLRGQVRDTTPLAGSAPDAHTDSQ